MKYTWVEDRHILVYMCKYTLSDVAYTEARRTRITYKAFPVIYTFFYFSLVVNNVSTHLYLCIFLSSSFFFIRK